MKISLMVATLAVISHPATGVIRQDTSPLDRRAQLTVADVPLASALTELQRRSGVPIAYSADFVAEYQHVACECLDVTVRDALDRLLTGTSLRYEVRGARILILPPREQSRTLAGRVLAVETLTPLPDVHVRLLGARGEATTDSDGRFSLPNVPRRPLRIELRVPDALPDTVTVTADRDSLYVAVRADAHALEPIVVTADAYRRRERFETTAQTSRINLDRNDLAHIPGAVESDVLRALQSMPGVVAKHDFSIGYNVRGGENDQNLVLLDGFPVFNPSHLGGLFSTFDVNVLDETNFYTGGFPARYSGRLSSILDLSVKAGSRQRMRGSGQVSLLSSKLALEGPLGPGSFVFGARRTYADVVVATFTTHTLPYYFTDLVGKLTFPIGRNGSLSATGYFGRDVLNDRIVDVDSAQGVFAPIDLVVDWGNLLGGLTWHQLVGPITFTTRAGLSRFSSSVGVFPDYANLQNELLLLTGGTQAAATLGAHDLRVGVGAEVFDIRYAVQEPGFVRDEENLVEVGFLPLLDRRYRPTIVSAFAEDQWRASSRLLLRPGIRVEHVARARATAVAPRFAAKLFLTDDQAVTASVGRYHQAVHSLRDPDFPITIFEFWIGANESVPIAKSDQAVLGYERWLGRDWQMVIEGYYREFRDLVIPDRGFALRDPGDEFLRMEGESWGADLLIRKHAGTVRGWLGYGFNRSIRRAGGVEFPPSHDRRHMINLVLDAPGPLGADMGLRVAYGSPLPFTAKIGEWDHRRYSADLHAFGFGSEEPIASGINAQRFPYYSRIDLGLRWQFLKWGVEWQPYFQVANLINRKNVFMYFDNFDPRPPERRGVSQLPIFPSFGIEFAW
jgi:hypothetical protein